MKNTMINLDHFDLYSESGKNAGKVEIDYRGIIYTCYVGDTGIGFVDEGLPSYEEDNYCMTCEKFLVHCHCHDKKNVSAEERKTFEAKYRTVFVKEIVNPWTQVLVDIDSKKAYAIVNRLAAMRRKIFRKQRKEHRCLSTPTMDIYDD